MPAPLTVGLSTTRGLYVAPTGLTYERGVSLRLGALEVQRISVELAGVDRGVAAEMRTALALKLGPVQLTAEGLGVALTLAFPEDGGNVGPVDLGADVLAPTGRGGGRYVFGPSPGSARFDRVHRPAALLTALRE